MIKISDRQLEQGLAMIRCVDKCAELPDCFWAKRESFPKKQCCTVPGFRDDFESDSPVFFGRALQFAAYEGSVYNIILLERGTLKKLKVKRRVWTEFYNLYVYTKTFLFVFFPLYLANNEEIPFLSSEEIEEREKELSQKPIEQISDEMGEKMQAINRDWLDWIRYNFLNDFNRSDNDTDYYLKYVRAITLLVDLFLTGMQRNKIPDILAKSTQEKDQLFQEIKASLF